MSTGTIYIEVNVIGSKIYISGDGDTITVNTSHIQDTTLGEAYDFAVWYFLPIAMVKRKNIYVNGRGYMNTKKNAEKMAEIWQSWRTGHLYAIEVDFSGTACVDESERTGEDLCFYSGGVDSTFMLLDREARGDSQALITVQGMDYASDDDKRFCEMVEKTSGFARHVSTKRIFVQSDAYSVYNKYKINRRNSHITHIFSLCGAGFLHSKYMRDIAIAADAMLDMQFIIHPWGSNSATNPLFASGPVKLVTESLSLLRSEKMPALISSDIALNSLTFCGNKATRPLNCGTCSKCVRTKLMMLATTGQIPQIFVENALTVSYWTAFDFKKPWDIAFFLEIVSAAKKRGMIASIPELEVVQESIFKAQSVRFLDAPIDGGTLRTRWRRMLGKMRRTSS